MSKTAVAPDGKVVRECSDCHEVKPLGDFSPGKWMCKPCRRDRRIAERAGARLCDVWIVCANGECTGDGDESFHAVCACGHEMAGMACKVCLKAVLLGCLTCWREKRHKCAVTFREPAAVAS